MSWSPENTIITNVGLEMLAKAQVGIGKLNITKIVTTNNTKKNGEDFTVEENRALTGDSTQITYKQECEIMNVYGGEVYDDAEENQNAGESRITARVSNESVSATGTLKPYDIRQIIIFARLTDLSDPDADMGEVPYMVAQSTGTYDHMPDFSENPVAINYDLYILHSGVAQITVKNDVSGYTPKETFDSVVKEIKSSIKNINDTKAGENTANITTFKPWTPTYTLDDEHIVWSKTDGTAEISGKKSAERFNQYGSVENNIATGENSHAENSNTVVLSENSHAEGSYNHINSLSPNTHVEGEFNSAVRGKNQHIEGSTNQSNGENTHVEGEYNRVNVSSTERNNHVEGRMNLIEGGSNHHVSGTNNKVSDTCNSVHGDLNKVSGRYNSVLGNENTVEGLVNIVGGSSQYLSGDTDHSFVTGNDNNIYATKYSQISGASNTVKSLINGSVSGAAHDILSVNNSNISGNSNTVKGSNNSDVSGESNTLNGSANNSVVTGANNSVQGSSENTVTGNDNSVTKTTSSVVTGEMNTTNSETISSHEFSVKNSVVSGNNNTVKSLLNSSVLGNNNKTSALESVGNDDPKSTQSCDIIGQSNTVKGCVNSFIGGESNVLTNVMNSLVVGSGNNVSKYLNYSLIAGKNNTLTDSSDNHYTLDSILCVGENNVISNESFPEAKGALGEDNEVQGAWSYAFGHGLKANSFHQTVVGQYNSPIEADFVVGSGISDSDRKNSFWVSNDKACANGFETDGTVKGHIVQGNTVLVGQRSVTDIMDSKIAALIDGAPETLNTLKELADALSSAEDVIEALRTYSVEKKFIVQDTELTSSNGVCTWAIAHGFDFTVSGGNLIGGYIIQITDNLGNVVNCNLQNSSGVSVATFSSSSNISANTYKAIVIGNSSANKTV